MQRIIVHRRVTVPLTERRSRMFPAGWSGSVPDDQADEIVRQGAGELGEERRREPRRQLQLEHPERPRER